MKSIFQLAMSNVLFIGKSVTVLAKVERLIVTTYQRRYNHEFVLGFPIILSLDSTNSPHRKLQGGGLPIPSISDRNVARRVASRRVGENSLRSVRG